MRFRKTCTRGTHDRGPVLIYIPRRNCHFYKVENALLNNSVYEPPGHQGTCVGGAGSTFRYVLFRGENGIEHEIEPIAKTNLGMSEWVPTV